MVWECFAYDGVGSIAFPSTKINSKKYLEILNDHLLPNATFFAGNNWKFQQDNAAVHTSRLGKQWFSDRNVDLLGWPSKSPDQNSKKNLWVLFYIILAISRSNSQSQVYIYKEEKFGKVLCKHMALIDTTVI
ncbi:hypothetical protein ILUMI_23206 [Ignelater luminosus]|uniref:Uncharacterized protein n=1 Tax=Ignelater luminosus TaxID=2038154 RepID=A0A8K0CEC4_IGNLU|nr:hypothetical protein ILUMI_23206 [Ignelater luminosus]